ncbi:hypothetical protein WBU86_05965 [Escherichia coli]
MQGRPIAAAPAPRALANKIAAARCPRLIPYGYRVGDFDATNTGAVCN